MLRPENRPRSKPRLAVAALLALIVVIGSGIFLLWRDAANDRAERSAVEAALPAMPSMEGRPEALARRLRDAEARALEGPDRAEALASLASLYHANGFAREAMAAYEAWLWLEPGAPKAAYRLATLLAGYGNAERAMPLLETVLEEAPDYLEARLQLADLLFKVNRPAEAAGHYQAVLEVDPGRVGAWAGAARVAMLDEDWQGARRHLEEATTRHPGLGWVWSMLGTVYERLGMDERSREARWRAELNTVTGQLPDPWIDELMLVCFDSYRLRVAAAAYRPAEPEKREFAIRLFERALAVGGERAVTLRHFGQMLIELGRHARARQVLEEATELEPEVADNWAHLIVACQALEDHACAERAIFEGLARNPDSPSLLLEQGRWFAARQRYAEALQAFEASRRARPGEAVAYVEIALVHFRRGRTAEGVAELRRALEVDPVHPLALTTLALHAINTRDRAAADEWLQRSREQPRVPRSDIADLMRRYDAAFGQTPG